jgi:hypothetical protein
MMQMQMKASSHDQGDHTVVRIDPVHDENKDDANFAREEGTFARQSDEYTNNTFCGSTSTQTFADGMEINSMEKDHSISEKIMATPEASSILDEVKKIPMIPPFVYPLWHCCRTCAFTCHVSPARLCSVLL